RVVVLAAGRNVDYLRFDVLRDHPHLLESEVAVGESGERGGGSDHQCGRPRDSRSCGRFRVSFNHQTLLGCKKLQETGSQRQPKALGGSQVINAGELLLAACVDGSKLDATAFQWRDATAGEDVYCEV